MGASSEQAGPKVSDAQRAQVTWKGIVGLAKLRDEMEAGPAYWTLRRQPAMGAAVRIL